MVENISPKDDDVYTIPSGPWGCLSWQAANNPYIYIYIWLVVSTPLKKISQLGRIIPYMKWKNKNMFQTTNQIYLRAAYDWIFGSFSFLHGCSPVNTDSGDAHQGIDLKSSLC